MSPSTSRQPTCTLCGGPVKRVHRRQSEVRAGSGMGLRRYRCLDPKCNWQGLLPRTAPRVGGVRVSQVPVRWHAWATAFVLVLVFVVAVVLILRYSDLPEHELPPLLAPADVASEPAAASSSPGTSARP